MHHNWEWRGHKLQKSMNCTQRFPSYCHCFSWFHLLLIEEVSILPILTQDKFSNLCTWPLFSTNSTRCFIQFPTVSWLGLVPLFILSTCSSKIKLWSLAKLWKILKLWLCKFWYDINASVLFLTYFMNLYFKVYICTLKCDIINMSIVLISFSC